jgi:hypothetical protein
MIKSSSIEILKSLEASEFSELGKFIRSAYFNTNENIITLYDVLKKYYPTFESKNLTKEKVHRKIFPKRKYNDDTMRKLLSILQKLTEDFLSHSSLKIKNFEYKTMLLEKLDSKKQDRLFEKELGELELKCKPVRNIEDEYFINNYFLSTLKSDYILGKGKLDKNIGELIDNSLGSFKYLICYCLIITFKIGNDMFLLEAGGMYKRSDNLLFKLIENFDIKSFIDALKRDDPVLYPVVSIYYHNFMILAGDDSNNSHFDSLKKLINEYLPLFARFERCACPFP